MTTIPNRAKPPKVGRTARNARSSRWALRDAKARFRELVRRVRSEGPQHVTVQGKEEVVVISAEEFRRLKGDRTGAELIAAVQASPHRDDELPVERARMRVRDIPFP